MGGGGLEERFRGKWADSRIDQPGTLGEEQETPGDGPGRSRRPQGTARALDARQTSRHAEPLWRTTRGPEGETVVSPITLRDINPFYTRVS